MRAYLSVDLDFWNARKSIDVYFLTKVINLKVPTFVVQYHHHLLKHIRKFNWDKLINVDYHSDFCFQSSLAPREKMNEGNWTGFLDSTEKIFEWRAPTGQERILQQGLCDSNTDIWRTRRILSPEYIALYSSSWAQVYRKTGFSGIFEENIIAVGICLSPNWTKVKVKNILYPHFDKFRAPHVDFARGSATPLENIDSPPSRWTL